MAWKDYNFMDLEAQYVDMNKNLEMLKWENVSRWIVEAKISDTKTFIIIPFHIWERVNVTRKNSEWEEYVAKEIKEYFLEDFLEDIDTLFQINQALYNYLSKFLTFDLTSAESSYAIYNK